MVRVLLCHYFKSQRIFSESYQPTSLCSSREYLFVGIGGCRVFVYSLEQPNFPLVCQFSTISTALKLICNENSNFLATIERRQQRDATKFARVYFNWNKSTVNGAVRVLVAGHSLLQRNIDHNQQFLAIELPSRSPVTSIASCKASGNVIISTDGKLCLFRQCVVRNVIPEAKPTKYGEVKISDFEHFLDIDPGFVVRGIDLCGPYVTFRSKLEVRIIKLVFFSRQTEERQKAVKTKRETHSEFLRINSNAPVSENSKEVIDDNCTLWSFGANSPEPYQKPSRNIPSECLFRTIRSESTYTDTFLDSKEVLGPLMEVKGHPLKVTLSGRFGIGIAVGRESFSVQAITMLYRRFKAENLCNSDSNIAALHSLQLLPTYARGLLINSEDLESPLRSRCDQNISLCGICVLVSGPKEGYIYDVLNTPRLLSVYRYTRDTLKVSVCHTLLHAITSEGLETYTVRLFAAASEAVREKEALRLRNRSALIDASTQIESSSPSDQDSQGKVVKERNEEKAPAEKEDVEVYSEAIASSASCNEEKDAASMECTPEENSFNNSFTSDSKKASPMVSLTGLGPLEQDITGQTAGNQLANYLEEKLHALPMKELSQSLSDKAPSSIKPCLPIIELDYLNGLCPPSTLDICLIGMYPFVGPSYVMCSERSVILFTRASRAVASSSRVQASGISAQPEWSIYLLQNMDPVQLYKAVMPLASRCQKPNRQAFHHLVCEQHMFLRAYCLPENNNVKVKKKIKKLISESAANLGDLYSRADKEQLTYCSEYYDMSGLPFHDIVNRAWKLGLFGEGLANYLDRKLLGSDDPVVVSEGTAKKIFKIYSLVNPSRVSEVILMSSLTGFSTETSIAALEDLKKPETIGRKVYRFSALDNLVAAILYLNQCEPDHAQSALSSIRENELIETVVTNCFLLHGDFQHLTPLAQMLRKLSPSIFLEVLLRLHDSKKWSLEIILRLLEANRQDLVYNYQVTEFLEAVLNDKRRSESFPTAVEFLSNILLMLLLSSSAQKGSSMPSNHQHVPKGNGHFSTRCYWLNQLPPYSGSLPVPSPSCSSNRSAVQSSPRTPRHLARPVFSSHLSRKQMPGISQSTWMKVPSGAGSVDGCCCCCCTENLLKLQALLSSTFTSTHLCETVLAKIQDKEFKGDLSIQLLCYPRVGKCRQATALILEKCPHIMIPFGELFFNTDVNKWSHLLNDLLQKFQSSQASDDADIKPSREALLAVLRGVLSKLAQLTSPQQFLSLIPDEGALGFFLPYLEQCVRQRASDKICVTLTSDIENSIHLH